MVSCTTFMYLIHIELFVYDMKKYSNFIVLHVAVHFFSTTYLRDCLLSIVYSCLFCQVLTDRRCMGLFLVFRFYFVFYMSVFMPVPYFDFCSFVVQCEIRKHDTSICVLLTQDCFGCWGVFCVSIQIIRLFFLVLWKMPVVFW